MENGLGPPKDFIQGEAVNGIWKTDLLKYLSRIFNLRVLVETGTCQASTLLAVKDSFDKCYSIELSDHYYKEATKRISENKGSSDIELIHGNSATKLRELLASLDKNMRVLFWLDAHSSGGLTANEGDPLPEEIRAIIELSPNSLVVIDDQQNADLAQVTEAGVNLRGWTKIYRTGIVFLFKKDNYKIPEFV